MSSVTRLDQQGARRSSVWSAVLNGYLRGAPDPLMRFLWQRNRSLPFRELRVVGRRTGRERRLLVNLLEVEGRRFIGHPNGPASWTTNLAAAATATLVARDGTFERVRAAEVTGADREAVIEATTRLPAPSGSIYRAARRHILAVGRYFEIWPEQDGQS